MAKIKMDPAEMTTMATQLDKKGTEFHTTVTKMEQLVRKLCGAWEGAASDAFDQQFTELKPGFTKTEQLIKDLAQQVRDICKIISDTDDEIAKKLKS
ncbi:MAG: WXG100 family type VII secretion target [Clostridium sp.]|nr:WXG100 family type VII secretion target [Clostridium sp.]